MEDEEAILVQVRQRILAEREKRGYHVIVAGMMRAGGIAGNPIPATFEVYFAETTCAEDHPGGRQCLWIDLVFRWREHWQVVLYHDLLVPGTLLSWQARNILADFAQQVEQWHRKETEERIKHLMGKLPFIELIEPHEFAPGFVAHEQRWYKIVERGGGKVLCQECTAREFALLVLQLRDLDPTRGKQPPNED